MTKGSAQPAASADRVFDADLAACAGIVERGDPDRFRATMAAPVQARARLFPLYACNVEVARAPWVTKEPLIARMRLQWWTDALTEIAEAGFVRRHEVVTPLAMVLGPGGARDLLDLVAARDWDVEPSGFADEAALWDYLDATSGILMAAAARVLAPGVDDQAARLGGRVLGLVNWFRAIPALEDVQRRPLPDGRPGAIAALARTGLGDLVELRAMWRSVPKDARPAFYPLAGAGAVLRKVAAQPGLVAAGRVPAAPRLRLGICVLTGRLV